MLSMFQGLTLAGEEIFHLDLLNQFLNSFVKRLDPEPKSNLEKLTFHDILAFLELYLQFLKVSPALV